MLPSTRNHSPQFPRPKIYLSHLNQLMDKKVIVQPEIEVNNKLFPQRDFARRLATSHQRTKSSIQLRSQRFDLHWTNKRNKNLLVENSKQAVTLTHHQNNQIRLELPLTKSTQLPSNASSRFKEQAVKLYSTYTGLPHTISPQSNASPEKPSSPEKPGSSQKKFLRRGSNIQKQIVINLLRNKLLRERQETEKKEYSNSEIIKMIQVFKGVALDEYSKKTFVGMQENKEIRRNSKRRDTHRDIGGWENEPLHDYELHIEKEE